MSQSLSEIIESSDQIIIGIGSEWDWVTSGIRNDTRYKQLLEFCSDYENSWLLPIIEYEYAKYNSDSKIQDAYKTLRNLIGEKKYFLVSDIYVNDAPEYGFDKSKCVYPCGNYRFLQTFTGDEELIETENVPDFMNLFDTIHCIIQEKNGVIPENMTFAKPFYNGKELYLNQKRLEYNKMKYNETEYKPTWDDYMKFLSRTLNSKLLILELGVGLEYPTVVRWPFEKVVFINKKAHLIRVHNKLYQHTKEIEDKTDSIQMNSVDYVLQES